MNNKIDLDKIDINSEPPTEEPARQYYFMAKCRGWVHKFEQENGRLPSACVTTFGCQMNARDSEKLRGILREMGYAEAPEERADFVIYNTCTVRENANTRVYGRLGQLKPRKKKYPHMMIGLCGCMMQEPEAVEKLKKSYRFVDIIFGTHNIYKFAELVATRLMSDRMVIDIWKDTDRIVEDLPNKRKYAFKSGVNIMFGCNNFCSYCIVPYVRGRERSRDPKAIVREIERLVADGVSEVMLLGQNVNSYGKTLDTPMTFARLLREIEKIEGLKRIRFMTSHPKDLSDELIEVMANSKKICKHLHLPVQSGSTEILAKMNRRYTKEQYLSLVEKIRAAVPDISLTTDIIVGFPGETEADFEETLDVVRKVRYDSAFTFIYSKRSGTPAAVMEDQVPQAVIKDRFDRLLKEVQEIAAESCAVHEKTVQEVLVEDICDHDPEMVTGRLSNNLLVHFCGGAELIGKYVDVRLEECRGFYYIGQPEQRHTVVKFYEEAEDSLLKFAVIVATTGGKYVFCKHKSRETLEVPGGHREAKETILEAARRELYEETGAIDYDIEPVCVYSVTAGDDPCGQETFGMLYHAEIRSFESELHSEIEKIVITEEYPKCWTYPEIQPKLLSEAKRRLLPSGRQ